MKIICLDFNENYTFKKFTLYKIEYANGFVREVWARDAIDALDAFDDENVVRYGRW